ncbi:hypothetical protein [Cylindrospermopsis raciborskii]|uniref:hypothetical protein n=1 Tax=Cylindrospermopsis raciborskii TaxID=77022 RepID=UPI0008DDD77A|nr:hypothetical protein [Cylindrospermopsis raciborskii]OHY34137.1 hypothetical protein BCV64_06820 [Cylindrospermopsis raciborskii MVCC14]
MSIRIAFIITGLNTGGAEMMLLKLLERLSPEFVPKVISLTDIGVIGQSIQSLGIPDGFFHTKTIRQKWEEHLSGGRN